LQALFMFCMFFRKSRSGASRRRKPTWISLDNDFATPPTMHGSTLMAEITRGSGNVFADIGVPDAETHLVKAELVRRIGLRIEAAKLTQAEAAKRMAMSQPDVSKMLRGQFRPISLEKLMQCLVALGQTVTIDVSAPTGKRRSSAIRVVPVKVSKREVA
jgi:predicted XRE-type DNA-binding protein